MEERKNPITGIHFVDDTTYELNKRLRGKPWGINRKNLSIYLPAVKNLIERRSKLREIKSPLGDLNREVLLNRMNHIYE